MLCVIPLAAMSLYAGEPGVKSTNVTVYNSDLGVIKEIRTYNLTKGISEINVTNVPERIDPTSVNIDFNGQILEQNYRYDLASMNKILEKYIDQDVTLVGDKTYSGKLVASNGQNIVLQKKDGSIIMLPNIDHYQISLQNLPDGLMTKPTLVWKLNAEKSGQQDMKISYQTSGMNWHTEYVGILNDDNTKMDLSAWVSIENNSGKSFVDANVKLIAGDVQKVKRAVMKEYAAMDESNLALGASPIEERSFYEYHIYDIKDKVDLANDEIKQISLFSASNVNVKKHYRCYDRGVASTLKTDVVLELENKEKNKLGYPFPEGTFRLFQADGSTNEFIGEDKIQHTPKDEIIYLKSGAAFDVVTKETISDDVAVSDKINEITYKITINNHKKQDINLELTRNFNYTNHWEILSSNYDYSKVNSNEINFKIPVNADSNSELIYKVRIIGK